VDQDNQQVGVVSTVDAIHRAREAGLDLVEVAPNSVPPVCRIMDFGKWRYEQKKKEQKAKTKQHQATMKEVRLRPKIEEHDQMVKTKHAREFLVKGNRVQFTMQFKGREMAHKEIGEDIFKAIMEQLQDVGKVEMPMKMMGRRMTMVMAPGAAKAAVAEKAIE